MRKLCIAMVLAGALQGDAIADPALEAKLKERAKLFENGERIHSGWPEVE